MQRKYSFQEKICWQVPNHLRFLRRWQMPGPTFWMKMQAQICKPEVESAARNNLQILLSALTIQLLCLCIPHEMDWSGFI